MAELYRSVSPEEITPELEAFWLDAAATQDRINVLTRSPDWFRMMADGRSGSVVHVMHAACGKPQAVLPVIKVKAPWGGDMMKVVGGELLASCQVDARAVSGWMNELCSSGEHHAFFFDHLSEEHFGLLKNCAKGSAFTVMAERTGFAHHRLVLPGNKEDLSELHSKRTAQKVRNSERRMRDVLGELTFHDIRSYKEIEPIADQIDKMMNATWQARELGRRFSVMDLKDVAKRGWLRCFALQGNERVIAFAACYQGMGTLVYEIIGYDERYARCSPGKVLLYRLLEKLYDENTPEFVDYGEGVADYKSGVANDSIEINRAYLLPARSLSCMPLAIHCIWMRMALQVKARIDSRRKNR